MWSCSEATGTAGRRDARLAGNRMTGAMPAAAVRRPVRMRATTTTRVQAPR